MMEANLTQQSGKRWNQMDDAGVTGIEEFIHNNAGKAEQNWTNLNETELSRTEQTEQRKPGYNINSTNETRWQDTRTGKKLWKNALD